MSASLKNNGELRRELAALLNRHSVDAKLETPDFLLASHALDALESYGRTLTERHRWLGGVANLHNALNPGRPNRFEECSDD